MLKSGGVVHTVIPGIWEVEVKGPLKSSRPAWGKRKTKVHAGLFLSSLLFHFPSSTDCITGLKRHMVLSIEDNLDLVFFFFFF